MQGYIHKIFGLTAILVISIVAGRFALADYYYEKAKRTYDSLNFSNLSSAKELSELIDDIDKSISLRGGSADALDFKADLLYQSWWLSPDGQYLQDSLLLQRAVELHLQAHNYRQGWAFSAARLALIYSNQAELDDQFNRWFIESHRLGLNETRIARSLMIVGLQNWAKLNEPHRAMTLDFIGVSIEQKSNSPTWLAAILERFSLRDIACARLTDTSRKKKVCAV